MNIDNMTYGELKQIAALFSSAEPTQTSHPLIGKNVIVRTVTMIYTGKLEQVTKEDFALSSCAWIPETERYADFVATGKVRECEPYPDDLQVFINRGALLDCVELRASLPRSQK